MAIETKALDKLSTLAKIPQLSQNQSHYCEIIIPLRKIDSLVHLKNFLPLSFNLLLWASSFPANETSEKYPQLSSSLESKE